MGRAPQRVPQGRRPAEILATEHTPELPASMRCDLPKGPEKAMASPDGKVNARRVHQRDPKRLWFRRGPLIRRGPLKLTPPCLLVPGLQNQSSSFGGSDLKRRVFFAGTRAPSQFISTLRWWEPEDLKHIYSYDICKPAYINSEGAPWSPHGTDMPAQSRPSEKEKAYFIESLARALPTKEDEADSDARARLFHDLNDGEDVTVQILERHLCAKLGLGAVALKHQEELSTVIKNAVLDAASIPENEDDDPLEVKGMQIDLLTLSQW